MNAGECFGNPRAKKNAQTSPTAPKSTKVLRHDNHDITQITSNGVNAPPQRALNQRMLCARVRCSGGSQIAKDFVRFGKQPASPAPKMRRATSSDARFQT